MIINNKYSLSIDRDEIIHYYREKIIENENIKNSQDIKFTKFEIKCNSVKNNLKIFLGDFYEGKYGKKYYKE